MRVYTNPEKLKRIKEKEKNKKSKPLPYEYHTLENGEKIKFIPCVEEHYVEVQKKIRLHSSNTKNPRKFTHKNNR
jgi:hypothetical protein